MLRVPDSALEYDEELLYYYRGHPFTGIGYEDGDDVRSEVAYEHGVQQGVSRNFYKHGGIKAESTFRENVLHGALREFDESGTLRYAATYAYGICVESRRWDSSGLLVDSFVIPDDGEHHAILEKFRREHGWTEPTRIQDD